MSTLFDRSEQILGVDQGRGDYAYEAEIYLTPSGKLKLHGPDGWIAKLDWPEEMSLGGYFIVILGNQDLPGLAYRGQRIASYEEVARKLEKDFPAVYVEAVAYAQAYSGDIEADQDFEPEVLAGLRAAFR
jgi:hypothetical protein